MTYSDKAALRGEPSYVWRSGQDRRLAMIEAWADTSGSVLDCGCGSGVYLSALTGISRRRIGIEIEAERAASAALRSDGVSQGAGEFLPLADDTFDVVLSNEVIEHVVDDALAMREMVRVTRPGGRVVIFCPNRWYPVEQHGIYWRGTYRFGNKWGVNYLPNGLRNRLAPHVRVYTRGGVLRLAEELPVRIVHHSRIFGGYDNISYRWPRFGRILKRILYAIEHTPLQALGISHFLVLEKISR